MKIVQCFFTFETGGAQILALELLNEMSQAHDVCLIIINNKFNKQLLDLLDKKVRVIFIYRQEGTRNPYPVMKLNLLLFRMRPDIIHCHEPNAARIIKVKGPKLVHTIHDTGIETTYYHLYHQLVAISNAVRRDVGTMTELPVETVFNGIPMKAFKRRSNYDISAGEKIRIVQVSRLMHEKKGQDILLRALQQVIHEHGFSDFQLDFVGGGLSMEFLKALAAELDLQKHVNFLGEKGREWLLENISGYHLLVQPSRYEGFGLTILEGFAAGLPVIASNIAGPAEIINGMPGGFLFENENIMDCAGQLYKTFLMFRNAEIGGRMAGTIPVIESKYSIENCTGKYQKVYERLLSRQSALPSLN